MDALIVIVSCLFLLVLISVYFCSGHLFTLPFLIMAYISFLYIGALRFYIINQHYTFIFVFFIALFYLLGILIANKFLIFKFNTKKYSKEPLKFYIPLNTSIFKLSLTILSGIAIAFSLYRVKIFGIILIKGVYTVGIESTAGVRNQLLYTMGSSTLLFCTLLWYGIYNIKRDRGSKIAFVTMFLCYIAFAIMQGGKSAPFYTLLNILIANTYAYKRGGRTSLLIIWFTVLFFPLHLLVETFHLNQFSLWGSFMHIYDRLTMKAIECLDYILYDWEPVRSYIYGGTILLEIKRIIAQLTGTPKEPLFTEYIMYHKAGVLYPEITQVGTEISIFGMGYVNFGFAGATITAIALGFVSQRINIYLLSRRAMNVWVFTLWIIAIFEIWGLSRLGHILIVTEDYFLDAGLPSASLLIIYLALALPFPQQALKWGTTRPFLGKNI